MLPLGTRRPREVWPQVTVYEMHLTSQGLDFSNTVACLDLNGYHTFT